jgi:hypothetical protein
LKDLTKELKNFKDEKQQTEGSELKTEAFEVSEVFIINEIDEKDVKIKQELTIEGDQMAFTETLSDEEIDAGMELKNRRAKEEQESKNNEEIPPKYTKVDVEEMLRIAIEKERKRRIEIEKMKKAKLHHHQEGIKGHKFESLAPTKMRDKEEISWFYCDNCNYKGRSKSLLLFHMRVHNNNNFKKLNDD